MIRPSFLLACALPPAVPQCASAVLVSEDGLLVSEAEAVHDMAAIHATLPDGSS